MAVEMDGVGDSLSGFDDEVDPFIGGVELDDVRRGGEACVVVVDLQEGGVVPFYYECGGRHVPFEEVIRPSDCDGEVVFCCVVAGIQSVVGDKIGNIFVIAAVGVAVRGRRWFG